MRPELCGSSRDPAGATFSDLAVLPCEQDPSTGSKGDFANEADNDGSPIDASAFVPDAPSLRKERELRRFYPSPSGLFIDSEGRPLQPFSYISARPANKWLSAIAVVLNFVGKIYWKEEIEGANAWRGFDSHVKTLIDLNLLAAFHIFCDPLQQSSVKWFDENIDDDLKSLRRELHVFDISNSSRPLAAAPEAQASRPPPPSPTLANSPSTPPRRSPAHQIDFDTTVRPPARTGCAPLQSEHPSPTPTRPRGLSHVTINVSEQDYQAFRRERAIQEAPRSGANARETDRQRRE